MSPWRHTAKRKNGSSFLTANEADWMWTGMEPLYCKKKEITKIVSLHLCLFCFLQNSVSYCPLIPLFLFIPPHFPPLSHHFSTPIPQLLYPSLLPFHQGPTCCSQNFPLPSALFLSSPPSYDCYLTNKHWLITPHPSTLTLECPTLSSIHFSLLLRS